MSTPKRAGSARDSYRQGFAFSVLSMGTMAVLGLVTTVLVGRLYGVDVVGQFALAYAPTGVVWFLSSVREQPALVKRLALLPARDPLVTGLFGAVITFSFALTVVVAALVMLMSALVLKGPVGAPEVLGPALVILIGYVLVTNTGWNVEAVLSAFRAGRQLFWIRLHQSVVYLLLIVVGARLTDSVWGLVWAMNISTLTSVIHRLWSLGRWMRWQVPRASIIDGFRALPSMLAFGVKMVPGFVADGVSVQAATWILGITTSVPAVGAFNRAQMLGQRMVRTSGVITQMVFPTLVERRNRGEARAFDVALIDALRHTGILLLLPAAVGGGAARGVMAIFGPGFEQASDALALTLLIPALTMMSNLQSHALYAVERPIASTLVSVARMVVTLVVTVPCVEIMGITGAAVGLVVGCVADVMLRGAVVRRHLTDPIRKLWPPQQQLGMCISYGAGFAVAHATFDGLHGGSMALLAALATGSLAYVAAIATSGAVAPRDWERAGRLRDRLLARRRSAFGSSR